MDQFLIMLKYVLIFLLLAIPGYLLVKTKRLKNTDSNGLTNLLLYAGLPCMIIISTMDIKLSKETIIDFLVVALIFIIGQIATIFISKICSKYEPLQDQRRMARFCMVFPNNGFLGIPLAMALFGKSLPIIVVYTGLLNVLNNVMWPTYGNYMLTGDKRHISAKGLLTNSILIAFIIGTILNLLGVKDEVKEVVDYAKYFKGIVAPLSMTILGMKFAEIKITKLFTSIKVYYLSLVRLIIVPVLIVGALLLLRLAVNISDDIIVATFITFAMPSAAIASTLADKFNMDSENAVLYSLGSALFAVITIPLLYLLLNLII